MTAATTERLITLTQLRGAWAAVTSGVFDAAGADWDQVPVDVVVVGAHGGSGATTMALAIATAGNGRVLELATARTGGLVAASTAEQGVTASGWRRGTRGVVVIDYLDQWQCGHIPAPEPVAGGAGVTVVDLADAARGTPLIPHARALLDRACLVVVTAAATVPGMRHLGVALEVLGGGPLSVAVLGPARKRWPKPTAAALPAPARALERDGRLVVLPHHHDLAVYGLTPQPLPKAVLDTANELLRPVLVAGSTLERTQ